MLRVARASIIALAVAIVHPVAARANAADGAISIEVNHDRRAAQWDPTAPINTDVIGAAKARLAGAEKAATQNQNEAGESDDDMRGRSLSRTKTRANTASKAAQKYTPPKTISAAEIKGLPASQLIKDVDIPIETFELPNGLRVVVNPDHTNPVVAVSVWYGVGSKHEPHGKAGFAHLFEHLMFNGSENVPGDTFAPLQAMGATDYNGTTWFDRTNYFATVPTDALDSLLMLESDRMGYLLGAITEEKLRTQVAVVQNEKRKGDNQPYGLVDYEQLENLYPPGHPYHHATIGSMDDLEHATLSDARHWFQDKYGPNNAVIALSGDIDVETAREKIIKWFGGIPAGPEVEPVYAPVPDAPQIAEKTIYDDVPTPRLYRMWAVPGVNHEDHIALSTGSLILAGLWSSRLDDKLVRDRQVAIRVILIPVFFENAGQIVIYVDPQPGVSLNELGDALDRAIADFLEKGPTQTELDRASVNFVADTVHSMDSVGGFSGRAPMLAKGMLYSNNPAQYKEWLRQTAELTPEHVRAVTSKWLSREPFRLTVMPGERSEDGSERGGNVSEPVLTNSPRPGPARPSGPPIPKIENIAPFQLASTEERSALPQVGQVPILDFPDIERTRLSNGIAVHLARREALPTVSVRIAFDAGDSADNIEKPGLESFMLKAMHEGTKTLNAQDLATAKELLGLRLNIDEDFDTTHFTVVALKPNLDISVRLLSDFVRYPAFEPVAIERVRSEQINRIANEMTAPSTIAQRVLYKTLFGKQHPYSMPPSGLGSVKTLRTMRRQDLINFHRNWINPSRAKIVVVGNTTLEEITPLLEKTFGDWQDSSTQTLNKDFSAPIPKQTQRIILIDRPKSSQSVIMGGRVLERKGTDDLIALKGANTLFGGNFLSRINLNIREEKGWSYGVRSAVRARRNAATFLLYAPVQSEYTGASIKELMKEIALFTSTKGVTPEELERLKNKSVRQLPGSFETSGDLMRGLSTIVEYNRRDTYYEDLAPRYSALTAEELNAEARQNMRSEDLVFVVVGDASKIRGQLDSLGMPIENLSLDQFIAEN